MLLIHITSLTTFSHQNELSVALDLFNELNIRQCIFFEKRVDNVENFLNYSKNLSSKNIFIMILNRQNLLIYLSNKRDHFKIGIIATHKNFDELNILSEEFHKASI